MQSHAKENVVIAPIFLGQDDTTIDGNGRRSLKPMYMTCGNLRVQKRNQKWANTCVGYIPKPNKNHRPSNMSKEQWKRDKRQMFHDAMAEMLAPVRQFSKTGVWMQLRGRDGALRTVLVVPTVVIGSYDQPEAAAVVGKLDAYRMMHMMRTM
jgi:hypothetical protein